MIWEFGREDWEAAAPRPWLLVVRRMAAIMLGAVCGTELVLFLWLVM